LHAVAVPPHTPLWQVSPLVQASPSLHVVPFGSVLSWQFPTASQVSGLSHSVLVELPQEVPAGSNTFGGQTPEVPVQVSATSHSPASWRQTKVLGLNWSTQVLAVPLQWSVASQAPPCDVPVQVVVLGSKLSAGHAPELPVQVSATSHCPVSARQTKVAGRYSSTQAVLLPLQWSDASQAPPWDVPVHVVVLGSKLSAGHTPEFPVQVSATSH
jgi:hypothetical protein